MGDIADMMLDGDMCQGCGEILNGNGFAQFCKSCQKDMDLDMYGDKKKPVINQKKVKCDHCGKKVKETGLAMHIKDVHG